MWCDMLWSNGWDAEVWCIIQMKYNHDLHSYIDNQYNSCLYNDNYFWMYMCMLHICLLCTHTWISQMSYTTPVIEVHNAWFVWLSGSLHMMDKKDICDWVILHDLKWRDVVCYEINERHSSRYCIAHWCISRISLLYSLRRHSYRVIIIRLCTPHATWLTSSIWRNG